MKLSDLWESYQIDKKLNNYSPYTLRLYHLQIRLLIRYLGDIDAESLSLDKVKEYLLHKQDKSPNTLACRIKAIRSVYGWAFEEGFIKTNPIRKLKEPKQGKRIPRFLTEEEIEILRCECKSSLDRSILELAYSTGMRISEIHRTNIKDIDFDNRMITTNGKGNKERVVFFDNTCKFWLKKYLKERNDDCESLFITERRPFRRTSNGQLRYVLKRIAKRTNIKESVYFHRLRHSLATHLLEKDMEMSAIQKILGHARISTTQIYAYATTDRLKRLYDKHR